jgi:transcriptional regulator GlxA family with amidase domain
LFTPPSSQTSCDRASVENEAERIISDMIRLALAMQRSSMLYETAIASEVFGVDRSSLSPSGLWYDLVVCTADGTPHGWLPGFPTASYAEIAHADTVIVPSTDDVDPDPDSDLAIALREAHQRGARIVSLCTGAFVLAAAGILDGRTATTHWMHAADLARRYPSIDVRADVLYVDERNVLSSAGKTAALDLCIHLVRRDLGATAANRIARQLVVPAHRRGGQAQFITPPRGPRSASEVASTLEWAKAHLDQPLTVGQLAGHARLSTRQFARRVYAEVQTGPLGWLNQERVWRAQELLERTDASVEEIAVNCGMGTAATLRHHFRRTVGVAPTAYRANFRLGS